MLSELGEVLPAEFYDRQAHELARALLGHVVVSTVGGELTAGRLVELEVYGGVDDPACHADRGTPTERTASMFGEPGIAYIYRIYGMYDCFNIVAPRGESAKAAAILVRAVEPLVGLELMQSRRGTTKRTALTSGPGKLCQALAISREFDAHPLIETPLSLHWGEPVAPTEIDRTARIGLNPKTCGESTRFPWRYVVRNSDCLSR